MRKLLAMLLVITGFGCMLGALFFSPMLFLVGLVIETMGYIVWPKEQPPASE